MIEHTTGGNMSLEELAQQHNTQPSSILRLTAEHSPGGAYPANVAAYINGVFKGSIAHDGHMAHGLPLFLPSCSPARDDRTPSPPARLPGRAASVTTYLERGGARSYCHRQWQRTACPLPSC